jgi:hypothetical protein
VLLVVEARIGLPDHHDALGANLLGVGEAGIQPADVGRLARGLLGAHPGDLGVGSRLAVDAGVGVVVVGALDR